MNGNIKNSHYKNKIHQKNLSIGENSNDYAQQNKIIPYYNNNISNYTKTICIANSLFMKINKKIIISNSTTKCDNKNIKPIFIILPNSVIYYINSSLYDKKSYHKNNCKYAIYDCKYINQKYILNAIFLQIININLSKTTNRNYLISNVLQIIVRIYDTKIKKIYFYGCSKIKFMVLDKISTIDICIERGMHYVNLNAQYYRYVADGTFFSNVTKSLQQYFIYKIELDKCKMTNVNNITNELSSEYNNKIKQCTVNYNFLKNTHMLIIQNCVLNLTNIKNYYYLLFVKKIMISCEIIYDMYFLKSFNDILVKNRPTYFKIFFGKKYSIYSGIFYNGINEYISCHTHITNE